MCKKYTEIYTLIFDFEECDTRPEGCVWNSGYMACTMACTLCSCLFKHRLYSLIQILTFCHVWKQAANISVSSHCTDITPRLPPLSFNWVLISLPSRQDNRKVVLPVVMRMSSVQTGSRAPPSFPWRREHISPPISPSQRINDVWDPGGCAHACA